MHEVNCLNFLVKKPTSDLIFNVGVESLFLLTLDSLIALLLPYLLLCISTAHRTDKEHVVLVLFYQLCVETYTFRMVPLTLALAFDILFIIVLSGTKTKNFVLLFGVVYHHLS